MPRSEADDPRRRLLIQALAAGLFSATLGETRAQTANVFGSRPTRLPAGQSVYRIAGQVSVNEQPASLTTPIKPGDTVQTGKDGEIVFVVNDHSMLLRSESQLVIQPPPDNAASLLISGLRLLTGKILSVSRGRQFAVTTNTATIGIRGTGFYAESDPEQTYFCTCYGVAEIGATNDPESKETVTAKQHDRPLYIVSGADAGRNIRDAPFVNHTDQELALIETLVGRTPPFVFPKDIYQGPRRQY